MIETTSKIHGWESTRQRHSEEQKRTPSEKISTGRPQTWRRSIKTGHIWCFKSQRSTRVGGNVAPYQSPAGPIVACTSSTGHLDPHGTSVHKGEELSYNYNTDGEV
jgi:hypothetical protein